MVDAVLAMPEDSKLMLLAPVVRDRKGEFLDLFEAMQAQGYIRFRVDGATIDAPDFPALKKAEKHDIDVVIDRIKIRADNAEPAAPAPGRELRGGPASGRGPRPGRQYGHAALSRSSPASSPARSAATRCPSWSRACSPSTRRWVPARLAKAWDR